VSDGIGAGGSRHLRERRHDDGAVQILHEQCGGDERRNLHGASLPKRLFVAANKRDKACRALLFDRSIISSAICMWESVTQRIAPAGSAGSIYRPVIELRL
jgi:hypothetical protein